MCRQFQGHVRPDGHVVLGIVWYLRKEQDICCRKNVERRLCVVFARRIERSKMAVFCRQITYKKKKKKKKNEREMDFVTELIYRSLFRD